MSFLLLVVKPKVNYVADHFSPRHIFVFDPAALPAQIADNHNTRLGTGSTQGPERPVLPVTMHPPIMILN